MDLHTSTIMFTIKPLGSADGLVPDSSPSGWEFDSHGKLCFLDGLHLVAGTEVTWVTAGLQQTRILSDPAEGCPQDHLLGQGYGHS